MFCSECDTLGTTESRFLSTLEGLLAIRSPKLREALDAAAMPLLEALRADKIDVFLYQPDSDTLVAIGASETPLGRRQRRSGLTGYR